MENRTMQAIRFHEYGGPEKLALDTIPYPQPKPDEVVIRMKSAGVNPVDWKLRSGQMKAFMDVPLPWTAGSDGAGVIEEVGGGVKTLSGGLAVFGVIAGSYAEFAVAKAGDVVEKPAGLSFDQAAAVPIGALTAWQTVIETADVQPGQRVLVLGAAGGVGLFAVQLARWRGARVIGAASEANLGFVRGLGAEAVDYRAGPIEKQVQGVDVVIDTVGGDAFERSWGALKRGGVAITIAGRVDEEKAGARGIRAMRGGRASTDRLVQITELLRSKALKPEVGRVFSLAEAKSAHELSETGHGRGRIVLHIED